PSRPTAPDPGYRSITGRSASVPSSEPIVANRPSRARSLVGLVPRPGGTVRRLPPARPAMIRVTVPIVICLGQDCAGGGDETVRTVPERRAGPHGGWCGRPVTPGKADRRDREPSRAPVP